MKPLLAKHAVNGRVDRVFLPDENRFWKLAKALLPSRASTGEGFKSGGNSLESSVRLQTFYRKPVLALDPGETTGVALWDPSVKEIMLCQIATKEVEEGYDKLWDIINYLSLDKPGLMHVRYEDYRVYGHMTDQHAFAHLHTPQLIGAIRVCCHLAQVPVSCCLAMHAKTFWTDDKLKLCHLYMPGMKHARDAQRHLLRYMCEPNNVTEVL